MAVDGTSETTVVADSSHNIIMGWSPDGRQSAVHQQPEWVVRSVGTTRGRRQTQRNTTLVKPDTPSIWSVGLTASGTMYVWKYASPIFIGTAAIDLTAGKIVPGPATPLQRFIGTRGRPDWSADGSTSHTSPARRGRRAVHAVDSIDRDRTAPRTPNQAPILLLSELVARWPRVLTRGTDLKGRQGLYRIDAQTGDVTLVVAPYPGSAMPRWAPDGKHVYYRRESTIIERDLASGTEREAMRVPTAGARISRCHRMGSMSPIPQESPPALRLYSSYRLPAALLACCCESTHRNDWLGGLIGRLMVGLLPRQGAWRHGRKELWLLPANGEKPRKLDVDMDNWKLDEVDSDWIAPGSRLRLPPQPENLDWKSGRSRTFLPAQTSVKPSAKR